MNKVDKIKATIEALSRDELAEFRRWFTEFDAAVWDCELEDDVAAGRLDTLAEEAGSFVRGGAEVSREQRPPDDTPERRATFGRARSASFLARQVVDRSRR